MRRLSNVTMLGCRVQVICSEILIHLSLNVDLSRIYSLVIVVGLIHPVITLPASFSGLSVCLSCTELFHKKSAYSPGDRQKSNTDLRNVWGCAIISSLCLNKQYCLEDNTRSCFTRRYLGVVQLLRVTSFNATQKYRSK